MNRSWRHPMHTHGATIALALGLLLSGAPSQAAEREVFLRYGGSGGDYERIGLGLRLAPVWSADWRGWTARLRPEFELSRLRYRGGAAAPDRLDQGGIIGHLRFQRGTRDWRPYGEAALGLSLFSNDRLGKKEFSTHFQFSQHLGLGIERTGKGFAGYQYSHYSNADIDLPNDGVDLHQVVIGIHF